MQLIRNCTLCVYSTRGSGHAALRCRRRSPSMDGFPIIEGDGWCGDYLSDEVCNPPPEATVDEERDATLAYCRMIMEREVRH